jgi:hypothetical protein
MVVGSTVMIARGLVHRSSLEDIAGIGLGFRTRGRTGNTIMVDQAISALSVASTRINLLRVQTGFGSDMLVTRLQDAVPDHKISYSRCIAYTTHMSHQLLGSTCGLTHCLSII